MQTCLLGLFFLLLCFLSTLLQASHFGDKAVHDQLTSRFQFDFDKIWDEYFILDDSTQEEINQFIAVDLEDGILSHRTEWKVKAALGKVRAAIRAANLPEPYSAVLLRYTNIKYFLERLQKKDEYILSRPSTPFAYLCLNPDDNPKLALGESCHSPLQNLKNMKAEDLNMIFQATRCGYPSFSWFYFLFQVQYLL